MLLYLYDWREIIPKPFRHAETETVDNINVVIMFLILNILTKLIEILHGTREAGNRRGQTI